MKSSRKDLDRKTAVPEPYDSFFSFPKNKGGYSGVAVYCDPRVAAPSKAEEGLSGILQPKPPLSDEERISKTYPIASELPLFEDENGFIPSDFTILESEGRALILDFGLFVLINVYCPNEGSEARFPFKMNYHLLLEDRVKTLIAEGREVIVVGDINVVAHPLDHGEGAFESQQNGFWDHAPRAWFKNWLEPNGPMFDVIRRSWPERKGMFTCWNTKISARDTNYGARIDYVLVTTGLLPWVKGGDIQASVRGSDHCPVYVDLHDEITLSSGQTCTLREAMGGVQHGVHREAPRLAAKFWDEYSGKQTLLSSFFGKGAIAKPVKDPTITSTPSTLEFSSIKDELQAASDAEASLSPVAIVKSPKPSSSVVPSKRKSSSSSSVQPTKDVASKDAKKKLKPGQAKLSSFFSQPSANPDPPSSTSKMHNPAKSAKASSSTSKTSVPLITSSSQNSTVIHTLSDSESEAETSDIPPPQDVEEQLEADHAYALSLSQVSSSTLSQPPSSQGTSSSQRSSNSTGAWAQLLAPIKPPYCTFHGEPAKELKVNKPGPNRDKRFFICSRPVGPGYDAGKSRRLREEVDPRYKCDFFKWASDVRREQKKKSPSAASGSAVE